MFEKLLLVAVGATLMGMVRHLSDLWARRRMAWAEWAEGERLRQGIEEDDRHCLKMDVRTLERQLDLVKGNVEYLQTQNAGQGRDIEALQAWAPCIDRQIERNEGAAHQRVQGLHARLLVLEARKV